MAKKEKASKKASKTPKGIVEKKAANKIRVKKQKKQKRTKEMVTSNTGEKSKVKGKEKGLGMADKTFWNIKGDFLLSCNCDLFCPCVISVGKAEPTYGKCYSWWMIHIEEGSYGYEKLDGLSVGIILEVPGPLGEGGWTAGLYIDDKASDAAAEALEKIFSGQAGGPTGWFSIMISNYLGLKRVPIHYTKEHKGKNTWHVAIPKIIDGGVAAIPGAQDGPVKITNTGYWVSSEVIASTGTKSRIRDYGRNWDFSGQSAEFAKVDWVGP